MKKLLYLIGLIVIVVLAVQLTKSDNTEVEIPAETVEVEMGEGEMMEEEATEETMEETEATTEMEVEAGSEVEMEA